MDLELMGRWRMGPHWESMLDTGTGPVQTESNTAGFRQGNGASLGASLGADLVAVREILALLYVLGVDDLPLILRGARVDVRGVRLGILVGGNCFVMQQVRVCRVVNVACSDAENLSRVNVEAVLVDVGVVGLQEALTVESVGVE